MLKKRSDERIVGIIPARYNSTRFPGKPLADILGMTMIERVYQRASQGLKNVYVATDDKRIMDTVEKFGGKVIMTDAKHKTGTDRCYEALEKICKKENKDYDIVINIQGDEPFLHQEHLHNVIACFDDEKTEIATLIKAITDKHEVFNPNIPKVVIDNNFFALYFSRSPIPYIRNKRGDDWLEHHTFYKHIGIYAYRSHILSQITKENVSGLEKSESLEQLRWLENGFRIKTAITNFENIAVDTKEDLEKIKKQEKADEQA